MDETGWREKAQWNLESDDGVGSYGCLGHVMGWVGVKAVMISERWSDLKFKIW